MDTTIVAAIREYLHFKDYHEALEAFERDVKHGSDQERGGDPRVHPKAAVHVRVLCFVLVALHAPRLTEASTCMAVLVCGHVCVSTFAHACPYIYMCVCARVCVCGSACVLSSKRSALPLMLATQTSFSFCGRSMCLCTSAPLHIVGVMCARTLASVFSVVTREAAMAPSVACCFSSCGTPQIYPRP